MSMTQLLWPIDLAATVCSIFFFSLGSALDLKTREVPNMIWLIYGPVGLMLTIARLVIEPSATVETLISIAFTVGISIVFFYFGLWGGADAKALICLSLTLPDAPSIVPSLLGYILPFPVTVFITGYFCSGSVIIWLGLKNSIAYFHERSEIFAGLKDEPWWKKTLACVTGYRDSLTSLSKKVYLYPMEEVVEDIHGPTRKLHLAFDAETDRDQIVSKFAESLKKVGSPDRVWVNPGIPLLFFMLIALIFTLIVGDPIFSPLFRLTT